MYYALRQSIILYIYKNDAAIGTRGTTVNIMQAYEKSDLLF